jgi:hypothetical protein
MAWSATVLEQRRSEASIEMPTIPADWASCAVEIIISIEISDNLAIQVITETRSGRTESGFDITETYCGGQYFYLGMIAK